MQQFINLMTNNDSLVLSLLRDNLVMTFACPIASTLVGALLRERP